MLDADHEKMQKKNNGKSTKMHNVTRWTNDRRMHDASSVQRQPCDVVLCGALRLNEISLELHATGTQALPLIIPD